MLFRSAGVANARFEVADVQVHPFQAGSFDVDASGRVADRAGLRIRSAMAPD